MTAGGFSVFGEKSAGRRALEKLGATCPNYFSGIPPRAFLNESWSIPQDIVTRVKMFFYYLGRRDRFATCPTGQALRGRGFEVASQE